MEEPRLNHVALKVKDLSATRDFYENVLELKVQEERPGKSLMLKDNYGGIIGFVLSNEFFIGGLDHIGFTFFELGSFREYTGKVKERLNKRKMPYEEKEHHDKSLSLFFNDINGYKIQIVYLPKNYFKK